MDKLVFCSLVICFVAQASQGEPCQPPTNLMKGKSVQEEFGKGTLQTVPGEIDGVTGEWTILRIEHKFNVPETHTPLERSTLMTKLKQERLATDVLVGKDNHIIHELDIFKNGLEVTGSYLDQDAVSHYYMNWEFGMANKTCVLEFEAKEVFKLKASDTKFLRRPLARNE